jgi:hypothetical protein
MPKCTIIMVLFVTDHLHHRCNKFVTFEIWPLLATGNQPDQTETHVTSVQCAEATGKRAWLLNDG